MADGSSVFSSEVSIEFLADFALADIEEHPVFLLGVPFVDEVETDKVRDGSCTVRPPF